MKGWLEKYQDGGNKTSINRSSITQDIPDFYNTPGRLLQYGFEDYDTAKELPQRGKWSNLSKLSPLVDLGTGLLNIAVEEKTIKNSDYPERTREEFEREKRKELKINKTKDIFPNPWLENGGKMQEYQSNFNNSYSPPKSLINNIMKGWLDTYQDGESVTYGNIGLANSTVGLNTRENPALMDDLDNWLTTTPQGKEYFAMYNAGLNPKKQSIKQTLNDLNVSEYTKFELIKRVNNRKTQTTDSTKLLKLINLNQLGGNPNYKNLDGEWVQESPIVMADNFSKKIGKEKGLSNLEIRKLRDQKFQEIKNSSYGKKFRTQGVSNREYFDAMSNEIALHTQDSKRGAGFNRIPPDISEYAHAYRNEQEGSEILSGIISYLKHPYITDKGQQEIYNIPGQQEYDTHTVVSPILNNYFEGNIPIDKIKIAIDSKRKELSKLESGGKMQEHQPNFNNPSVSIPKDFVGIGNSIKGRNYSPAWGGQFQLGGILPGATGNLYTRHGAPSEGKHAKKTLPSAKDGNQLQNLDQLTNFNNFGQSSKWLDKYK